MQNKFIKSDRLVILSILLLIILSVYFIFLYKLQIIEGDAYSERSANSLASLQTVEAARGSIMDRYGRSLVTNSQSYNIGIWRTSSGCAARPTSTSCPSHPNRPLPTRR